VSLIRWFSALFFTAGSTLFDPADALELGTNALLKDEHAATSAYWQKLQANAEKEVLDTLPILKAPPPHHEPDVEYTPLRLYRYILPSSLVEKNDRSLVYLGLVTNTQTSIYAEVSALWGVSWMEGLLDISKSKEELDYEIAKVNMWMARRYLSRGRTRQIASAEIQDVTDILMRDMGLKSL
jgi:dimethylaniline monooxygenase (N-oxide forming)